MIRAEDYEWSAVHESGLIDVATFIASVLIIHRFPDPVLWKKNNCEEPVEVAEWIRINLQDGLFELC